jgi:hypothetical protein
MTQYYWPDAHRARPLNAFEHIAGTAVIILFAWPIWLAILVIALVRNEQPPGCRGNAGRHGR